MYMPFFTLYAWSCNPKYMYPFSIMRLNYLNQDSELSMKHPMEVDTGSK